MYQFTWMHLGHAWMTYRGSRISFRLFEEKIQVEGLSPSHLGLKKLRWNEKEECPKVGKYQTMPCSRRPFQFIFICWKYDHDRWVAWVLISELELFIFTISTPTHLLCETFSDKGTENTYRADDKHGIKIRSTESPFKSHNINGFHPIFPNAFEENTSLYWTNLNYF